jgi:hypothetical protein
MVRDTQNHWAYGLCASFRILNIVLENNVSETECLFSGGGRDTPTLLGSLERTNLSLQARGGRSYCVVSCVEARRGRHLLCCVP